MRVCVCVCVRSPLAQFRGPPARPSAREVAVAVAEAPATWRPPARAATCLQHARNKSARPGCNMLAGLQHACNMPARPGCNRPFRVETRPGCNMPATLQGCNMPATWHGGSVSLSDESRARHSRRVRGVAHQVLEAKNHQHISEQDRVCIFSCFLLSASPALPRKRHFGGFPESK